MTAEPTEGDGRRRASIGARRNPQAEAAILEAARAVLAERGYAGFSIDAVARLAGAGKPTIYRWWATKAELLVDVYGLEKDRAVPLPDLGSFHADLDRFGRDLWRFWRETPTGGTFCALIAEAQTSPAALDALRGKFLPARTLGIRRIVERAIARGEVAPDQEESLVGLFIGLCWFHLLTGTLDNEAALRAGVAILAAGAVATRGADATKSSLASAGEEG